jgi:L-threonylcarbamoyladenylate synthase
METQIFKDDLTGAAELLSSGGLVAVPTETVYGLAANGLDAAAVEKIYEVKGRPSIKPLSLMVPGAAAMDEYCLDVPQAARVLAGEFWPGPLTIILKAKNNIPSIVLAGGNTVGLRCPQHCLTLSLLNHLGLPLAAPSANPSGQKSPQTATEVYAYFNGKIEGIIDGGECNLGLESTIINMSSKPYKILRQGALSAQKVREALAENLNVIGITGGTGSGKTTALNMLKAMGALVLDCDEVYHNLLLNNEEMLSEIDDNFQNVIIDGALDRKALGAIVFNDDQELAILNSITHKYVDIELQRRLEDFAMSGGTLAAIDAIELFAGNQAKRCKKTVGILAKPEIRAQRIMSRDGISYEYAMLRIQAQHPDSYFENLCDYILRNDESSEEFKLKCSKLFEEIV